MAPLKFAMNCATPQKICRVIQGCIGMYRERGIGSRVQMHNN